MSRRGNGAVFFEVANRGRIGALGRFNRAPASPDPLSAADFGDGFLLEEGFTLLWVGWQHDTPQGEGLLRVYPAVAVGSDGPVEGLVRSDIFVSETAYSSSLGDRGHTAYPVADPADPHNVLTVRDGMTGERRVIPAMIGNLPDLTAIASSRTRPPSISPADSSPAGSTTWCTCRRTRRWQDWDWRRYATRYRCSSTARPSNWVSRMALSTAPSPTDPPRAAGCCEAISMTVSTGTSKAGVFSTASSRTSPGPQGQLQRAVCPAVPGAGRRVRVPESPVPVCRRRADRSHHGEYRWSAGTQGTRNHAQGVLYQFIHRVLAVGSGTGHTTPDGKQDLPLPDNSRIYHFAGTQHGPAPFPPPSGDDGHLRNPNDYAWFLRSLLVRMDGWITDDTPPPPSRYATLGDGTLVSYEHLGFPSVPGVEVLEEVSILRALDFGPELASKGVITREPPDLGPAYPFLVPRVDESGNELGGLRSPDIAVPLGTYTGWLPGNPVSGAGIYVPFARTRAERAVNGDSRPSVEERYGDRRNISHRWRRPHSRSSPRVICDPKIWPRSSTQREAAGITSCAQPRSDDGPDLRSVTD